MPYDPLLKGVSQTIPVGYVRVMDGPILPDDLRWSVMKREWKRHDDPDWLAKAMMAEDAVCVIRKPRHVAASGQQSRQYSLKY
ncbi:MAG: hypothetical protein ABL984_13965 [Pyrinomonadaceae bacterium]